LDQSASTLVPFTFFLKEGVSEINTFRLSLIIRLIGNVSSVSGQHTLEGPLYNFFPRSYTYVPLLIAAEQMKPKMPLPETHTNNNRVAQ